MSQFNFKKAAQDVTVLCPLMSGREKLSTSDIIDRDLTIMGFDFAPKFDQAGNPVINDDTGEVDQFGVVLFKEEPKKYYCVGSVFTKVCKAWASEFSSASEASAELAKAGGVRVRFTATKTKKGQNLTAVEILD